MVLLQAAKWLPASNPHAARFFLRSRAFIRAAYEDDLLPVPSPTYLLQNIYDELEGSLKS